MRKPNLFIPGFPKSGTSALHSALVSHPEIYDGGRKDPKTYTYDNRYKKRESFFKNCYDNSSARYILDSSTTYMVCKHAKKRILNETPNAKFIIVARDPIDRIVSHYNWLSSFNFIENKPLEEINNHKKEKFNYRNHYRGKYKAYIDFSLYGEQMRELLNVTDKSNVLFLLYEELFADFNKFKPIMGEFLNLNLQNVTIEKVNKTSFDKDSNKNKPSFIKRILGRLRFELRVLKGNPRGLNVNNPQKYKTTRNDLEDVIIPVLKDDILLLESLGYRLDSWSTFQSIKY